MRLAQDSSPRPSFAATNATRTSPTHASVGLDLAQCDTQVRARHASSSKPSARTALGRSASTLQWVSPR
jgi:hypothetical protein